MHEFGLMRSLMRQIEETAATEHASKVAVVRLRLGVLSGMDAAHLTHHFRQAVAGTMAETAILEISSGEGAELVLESLELES